MVETKRATNVKIGGARILDFEMGRTNFVITSKIRDGIVKYFLRPKLSDTVDSFIHVHVDV
jgi:hypothetical protein